VWTAAREVVRLPQGGVHVEEEKGGGALRHGEDVGRGSRWVFASNAVRHYEVEFLEIA
jgi:hypothetical protein